ncbi:DegT/DnrJ/EryC1/StrS family aminotransferase [Thermoproteota archaeon]
MNFFDVKEQNREVSPIFLRKLNKIMRKGDFVLGSDVKLFEQEFSNYCGTKFAIGVNSGADALFLSLRCLGIGEGDEVIVPAFTFIATSFAVSYTGAKPVFIDVDARTFNLDSSRLNSAITKKTKAIIPVHLFGLCAEMSEINRIAKKHKLAVIEDAAQSHGAKIKNKAAGSFGDLGCFSFYPTKNLSGCGDAGMITTNKKKLYERLLQLRDCGRSKKRYLHPIIGYNSRLDSIQASFIRLKLKRLELWNRARNKNAGLYTKLLKDVKGLSLPIVPNGYRHVYHIFPILTKKRTMLINLFKSQKIPFAIFYSLPLHLQKANRCLKYRRGDFPVSERIAKEIIALPTHPHLKSAEIKRIATCIKKVHCG